MISAEPLVTDLELEEHRADALAMMQATCRITRSPHGDHPAGDLDDDTLQYPASEPLVIYEGPCKVKLHHAVSATAEVAGNVDWTQVQPALHIPITHSGYQIAPDNTDDLIWYPLRGDAAEILTNPHDLAAVGRKVTIRAPHGETWATARRFVCTEGV